MANKQDPPHMLTSRQFSVGITSLSESFGVLMGYIMAVQAKFEDKHKIKELTRDMNNVVRAAQDVVRTAEALMELRGLRRDQ